jgi:hypothetical protein
MASVLAIIATYSCQGSGGDKPGSSNKNAGSTERAPAPAGPAAACDNLYYPSGTGIVRNYKMTSRGTSLPTVTYSEQNTSVAFGSFTERCEFSDGIRTDNQWSCTADGLFSSEFAIPSVMRLSTGYKFDSIRAAGPAIPAADKWAPGYEWTTTYQVTGAQVGGTQSQAKVAGTVEVKSQILSAEKVMVPAGSYDCLLVDSTIRESLRIEASQGSSRPVLVSVKVSGWYAKGVGRVRAAFSGDIGTGSEELTSINR